MITDVNYVKGQFKSWYRANNWLVHIYPHKLGELEFELTKIKAISYEEKIGGTSETESMRISRISDKMTYLEKEKKHNESICEICEFHLKRIRPQYQEIFEYIFKHNATTSYTSYRTGYSERRIYEVINEETERLSRE